MMVLLVLGGLQIATLGIIGEYLWRTLDEARQRPRYNIEKSVGGAIPAFNYPALSRSKENGTMTEVKTFWDDRAANPHATPRKLPILISGSVGSRLRQLNEYCQGASASSISAAVMVLQRSR